MTTGRWTGAGGGGGSRGPWLEQMIADSDSDERVGVLDVRIARALRNQLLRTAESHRDPERGVLARSVRAPRRVDVRLRFRNSVVYRRAQDRDHGAWASRATRRCIAWGRNPGTSPPLSLKSRMDTTRIEDVRVEELVPLTDSTKREPGMGMRQRTGIIKTGAHAGDGQLHADAHEHAAVRVRVRREDPRRTVADSQDPRPHRREARCSRRTVTAQSFRVDTVIDRGRSETSRMMKDVGGAWNDAGDEIAAGGHVRRSRRAAVRSRGVLSARTGERGRAHAMELFRQRLTAHADFPIIRITKPATLHSHAVRD